MSNEEQHKAWLRERIEARRREIEQTYRDGLRILDEAERLLTQDNTTQVVTPLSMAIDNGNRSQRDLVLAALRAHGAATVDQLAEITGLDKPQVRGVLYAPKLKHRFGGKEIDGVMAYYLRPDQL